MIYQLMLWATTITFAAMLVYWLIRLDKMIDAILEIRNILRGRS